MAAVAAALAAGLAALAAGALAVPPHADPRAARIAMAVTKERRMFYPPRQGRDGE